MLGETCKKIIMLVNDGALATKFHLKKFQTEASVDGISLLESVRSLNRTTYTSSFEIKSLLEFVCLITMPNQQMR